MLRKLFFSMALTASAVAMAAPATPVWRDPAVNQVNREARRADFFAFENADKAKAAEIAAVERELMTLLGTKVHIDGDDKKGKIELEYYSLDELNRLIDALRDAFK